MAKYEVLKRVKDKKSGKPIEVGSVIERTVKEIAAFEKQHGKDYLKRIEEAK